MPPKKREKDGDSTKNPRMDHIQADHELFLQAFESNYKYLHAHWNFRLFTKMLSLLQSPPKYIDI